MWRECRPLNPMDGCYVPERRAGILSHAILGALVLGVLDGVAPLWGQSSVLTPNSPVDSFATATARARFWFIAQVVRRDSVTTRLIDRNRFTTAVHVDSVIAAPTAIRPFAGRTITTIVGDTNGVVQGARLFFVASGVAVDTSLVVRERARVGIESPSDIPLIVSKLFAADTLNRERAVRRRADSSAMVAVVRAGSIVATLISGPGRGGGGGGGRGAGRGGGGAAGVHREDDPRWRRAEVVVLDSLAGEAGPSAVSWWVYFPGSRSWAYATAPRLAQDTVAVVLGRRLTSLPLYLRQGLDTTRAYVVLDSLDVRPARDSALVRRALR